MVETFNNTMSANAGLYSMTDSLSIFGILIVLIIGIIAVIIYNESNYLKFKKILDKLAKTLPYAAYGVVTLIIVGIIYGMATFVSSEISNGFPILSMIAVGIIGYFIICLFGIPLKKLIDWIDKLESKTKESSDEDVENAWKIKSKLKGIKK